MSKIKIELSSGTLFVSGSTYQYKDILKHYGFHWHPFSKSWFRTFAGIRVLPAMVNDLRKSGAVIEFSDNLKYLESKTEEDIAESKRYAQEDREMRTKALLEAWKQKRKYGE